MKVESQRKCLFFSQTLSLSCTYWQLSDVHSILARLVWRLYSQRRSSAIGFCHVRASSIVTLWR